MTEITFVLGFANTSNFTQRFQALDRQMADGFPTGILTAYQGKRPALNHSRSMSDRFGHGDSTAAPGRQREFPVIVDT